MSNIRLGICALLAFAVLAHGGVEAWAQAVLIVGSTGLFLCWTVFVYIRKEEKVYVSPLLLPLTIFAFVVLGQWIFHSTASAYETRVDLQILTVDLLLLFLAAQAFRKLEEWRIFVWFIMVFAFVVSTLGILQHLTFNGKLYWFREMHYGGIPFGPFVNRNHFAGFAELVIPIALVPLVLGKVRRERWFVVGLFASIPIVALLMSGSRGGIISFGAELGVIGLWMLFRRTGAKSMLAVGAVVLMALLLVSWLGVAQILDRFSSLRSLETTEAKRASMRVDTWHIFLDHPVVGTGLGTVQTVFPKYESLYDGKIVNHSHNDYLEALAETGALGGILCSWFLVVLFREAIKRLSSLGGSFVAILHLSALSACMAFLVHSFVDFNLHIPSNSLLFFLMTLLATMEIPKMVQSSPSSEYRHRRRRNP